MDILALERATLEAWPPLERATMFGWVLQASSGHSRRINSVWPLAWTGEAPLDAAIDRAEAWYRARGVRPCFKLVDGVAAPAGLRQALVARGYVSEMPTLVMTRALRGVAGDLEVTISSAPNEEFFAPMREDAPHVGDYEERRDALIRTPAPRAFAALALDGPCAATGASVVTGQFASIFVMRTASWARRRGLARRVLCALMAWGRESGAETAYLQVETANAPAVALYRGEGFEAAYSYDHWRLG